MDFVADIATNFAANVLFWLALGITVYVSTRTRMRRFSILFGLERTATVYAYLSDVSLEPPSKVSINELRAFRSLASLFDSRSGRYPELVRGLVDNVFFGAKPRLLVEVVTDRSVNPPNVPMILLGGGAKNLFRRYYLDTNQALAETSLEAYGLKTNEDTDKNCYVRILRGPDTGKKIGESRNCCIIEKLVDQRSGSVVISCVGLRSDSTWLGAEYLVRHWSELSERFGAAEFVQVIQFPATLLTPYLNEYSEPDVLFEFARPRG